MKIVKLMRKLASWPSESDPGDATPPRTRREIALSENSKQKSSQKSQSFVGLLLSLEFIPSNWQTGKLSNWQTGNWQTGQTASRLSGHDWQCRFEVEKNFKLFVTLLLRMAADIHFLV